jgi:Zn-dependent protease with chaperone function
MALPALIETAGDFTLGIGKLLGAGVQLAVMDWYRKSELTCDRFGVLLTQDLTAAQRTLMKLAGAPPAHYRSLNLQAFIEQGKSFSQETEPTEKLYQFFMLANQTHPWPAVRAYELQKWVDEGFYEGLLEIVPNSER